jgi:anaerobic magnesium-protoporphyrin IX monomethyl ester cyclase
MHVHGMFIFGADTDTVETIHETAHFVCKERIESIQFLILVPLPGTQVYKEMETEDRILTRDWSLYDAHHAVFRSKNMSPYTLMNETSKATSKVYSLYRGLGHLLRGKIRALAINRYGALQVRRWRKENYELLQEAFRNSVASSKFDPAMAGS